MQDCNELKRKLRRWRQYVEITFSLSNWKGEPRSGSEGGRRGKARFYKDEKHENNFMF